MRKVREGRKEKKRKGEEWGGKKKRSKGGERKGKRGNQCGGEGDGRSRLGEGRGLRGHHREQDGGQSVEIF